jgi:plastocyanin
MRFRWRIVPWLLVGLIPLGCGVSETKTAPEKEPATAPSKGEPAAHKVTIDHFSYEPRTLVVTPGSRVTWTNADDVPHTVTSTAEPRAFDSKALDTDGHFSHVFDKPGTYDYFCALHPKMVGRVIVK